MSQGGVIVAAWIAAWSGFAFVLFGWDKWLAGRQGGAKARVSESALCWVSALGGWPGGLLGILFFRHKSAKGTFQLKFALALAVWCGLAWAAWEWVW